MKIIQECFQIPGVLGVEQSDLNNTSGHISDSVQIISQVLAEIIQKGEEISLPPDECSWEAGSFKSGPEILR